jgi:hypothetical protein
MTQRVIAYIDGFNLYYGLKDKGWRRYYWLNLNSLSTSNPKTTMIPMVSLRWRLFISSQVPRVSDSIFGPLGPR